MSTNIYVQNYSGIRNVIELYL